MPTYEVQLDCLFMQTYNYHLCLIDKKKSCLSVIGVRGLDRISVVSYITYNEEFLGLRKLIIKFKSV